VADESYHHGVKIDESDVSYDDRDALPAYKPALDFSDDRNSQYIGQVI
jgi:hypothetical protein